MTKLLLVGDNPIFRQGLAILLKSTYPDLDVVGESVDGKDTVDKVESLNPDVIVMDLKVRVQESMEVVHNIYSQFPEMKVIVLSVSTEEVDFLHAIKLGVSAYLLKTTPLDELVDSIRSVVRGESVVSPSLVSALVRAVRIGETNGIDHHLYTLTEREKEILQYAALGDSNKEIADKCCISVTTVKSHLRNILGKMEVKNRTGAVVLANANGLLKGKHTEKLAVY